MIVISKQQKQIQTFYLNKTGTERVLGSLEAEIMEIIWQASGKVTIREVQEKILTQREISFNTVMTVMNRLVNKGLLEKEKISNSFHYRATISKADFLGNVSRRVARGLLEDFGESTIAHFVEAMAEVNPDYLSRLESLIRRKKDKNET
ncbi:transcriptional regulator [Calderihabitans maritimus]|uniref:Transcriptional regulator n=1 Tax=Calderihabitans maritimus TaxID=1246530 RepID=A0A1Z5HSM2_9FIRM|nr:transcriptional regulator [Calderihabitans maritimus]